MKFSWKNHKPTLIAEKELTLGDTRYWFFFSAWNCPQHFGHLTLKAFGRWVH